MAPAVVASGHPPVQQKRCDRCAGGGGRSERSLQNPALYTLIWVVVIIAVFAPLSVNRYCKDKSRS